MRAAREVYRLAAHGDPITSVDFNRDGSHLASGSFDGMARVWDTARGTHVRTLLSDSNPCVGCVRFSPNGRFMLLGTLDSRVRLWELQRGKPVKTYDKHKASRFCGFCAFSVTQPKRQWVITGSENNLVYAYDLQSRTVAAVLSGHRDSVLAVDASTKYDALASGGLDLDPTVRVWSDDGLGNGLPVGAGGEEEEEAEEGAGVEGEEAKGGGAKGGSGGAAAMSS